MWDCVGAPHNPPPPTPDPRATSTHEDVFHCLDSFLQHEWILVKLSLSVCFDGCLTREQNTSKVLLWINMWKNKQVS